MSDGDGDMSSDDTDFNPDALEALSAKEEYDSEPSSTSDDTDGEEVGFEYHKVASSRLSWLVTHIGIFSWLMNGKFDAYVLWSLTKSYKIEWYDHLLYLVCLSFL